MALGERGAARRHDVFHPFLPHPDQVHVSLNHQDLPFPADRRERLVESVQDGTLMVHLRFRGVEVLGDCIVDRAGTEAADSPPRVRDGKDHPSPEPLPVPAALAGDKKSRRLRPGRIDSLARESPEKVLPPPAVPEKEFLFGLRSDPSPSKELPGTNPGGGRSEQFAVRFGGGLKDPVQVLLWTFGGRPLLVPDRNSIAFGQILDCLAKRQAADLHQKMKNRPPHPADVRSVPYLAQRAFRDTTNQVWPGLALPGRKKIPGDATARERPFSRSGYPASSRRTISLRVLPSARPAPFGINSFMTRPMSAGGFAPA